MCYSSHTSTSTLVFPSHFSYVHLGPKDAQMPSSLFRNGWALLLGFKDFKGWMTKGIEYRPWCLSSCPALATRCPAVCKREAPAAGSFPRPAELPGEKVDTSV